MPGVRRRECLAWERMNLHTACVICSSRGDEFSQHEWQRAKSSSAGPCFALGTRYLGIQTRRTRFAVDGLATRSRRRLPRMPQARRARQPRPLSASSSTRSLACHISPLAIPARLDPYNTRREPYSVHQTGCELPDQTILVTAGVDIQDRFIAYEIVAWGPAWNPGASRPASCTAKPPT